MSKRTIRVAHIVVLVSLMTSTTARAEVYRVGSTSTLLSLNDVPWESLQAGDVVEIAWRPEPYAAKWVLCVRGTAEQPIVIRGLAGPEGQLPVITGRDARTRSSLQYWSESRGVIKIGGATVPADTTPAHLRIENLEICEASPPHYFAGRDGVARYAANAAAIFVEKGDHITIRNCVLRDSANGLFVAHEANDILVERCWIHDNGMEGSHYEHNAYTEAGGIVFQYNFFGPLRSQCNGNNLKDRSAGTVIRYNWIEGGNRQLDLVEPDEGKRLIDDPRYGKTLVYGNVLIERQNDGNNQIVHYGGDGDDTKAYRKGTLAFYNNTVISYRTDNTTLFRLSTNDQSVDCRNNILDTVADGKRFAILDEYGTATLSGNWLKTGWLKSHEDFAGRIDFKRNIDGTVPGFANFAQRDFRLSATSPCIDRGTALPVDVPILENIVGSTDGKMAPRPIPWDLPLDIGAFEFRDVGNDDQAAK